MSICCLKKKSARLEIALAVAAFVDRYSVVDYCHRVYYDIVSAEISQLSCDYRLRTWQLRDFSTNIGRAYIMKSRFIKQSAILIYFVLLILVFAACNENDISETLEYIEKSNSYDLYTQESTHVEYPPYIRTLFTGNIRDYEFHWHEGRDRAWEEDIIHFASIFTSTHSLLGIRPSMIMTPESLISELTPSYIDGERYYRHTISIDAIETRLLSDAYLRADFLEMINDLLIRIPELEDYEIIMGLYRSIANLPDDHTHIRVSSEMTLPFFVKLHFDAQYSEASFQYPRLHIRQVYSGVDRLMNTRILYINGVDIDEVIGRLRPLVTAGNDTVLLNRIGGFLQLLTSRDVLRYIAVVNTEKVVPITVRDASGDVFTIDVPFLNPLHDYEWSFHEVNIESLFFMPRPGEFFWYKYFPEESIMYARVSTFLERADLHSTQFWREMRNQIVQQSGVGTFVLDLRGNPGGRPLDGIVSLFQWARIEGNRELLGDMYVAIDFGSASQSVVQAFLFSNYVDNVTLIGSPAGATLNIFAGGTHTLPNSGLRFFVSDNLMLLDPYTETNKLYPDIFIYNTLEDFLNNHDAVFHEIRQRALN